MAEKLSDLLRKRGEEIDRVVSDAQKTTPAKPKAKAKPKEKAGTGKPSFDLDGAVAKLRAKVAATSDPKLKAKLKARIEAMKANQ